MAILSQETMMKTITSTRALLTLLAVLLFSNHCSAGFVLFSATSGPGGNPDANGNINLWTVSQQTGSSGDFIGDSGANAGGSGAGAGPAAWALWANSGGSITFTSQSVSTFLGRSLNQAGDNVSIDFDNGWIEAGGSVGVRLLSGSSTAAEFKFAGGDGNYQLIDSSSTQTFGFTGNGFNLKFTLTDSSGGYGLVANGNSYGGRDLASNLNAISSIEVYNINAGQYTERNFYFNNLRIEAVPEPTSLSLLGLTALAAMTGYRRRVS
jgi:hypothetical protein